jgi:hypothetical protein
MHRLHMWAVFAMLGGVSLGGAACSSSNLDKPPTANEREARSDVLKNLMASRERLPDPGALDAQRRDLKIEVQGGEPTDREAAARPLPSASIAGTVEWVGSDDVLFRDEAGQEQAVRTQADTRYVEKGREVSRRWVAEGAEVRVRYEETQGEWVAREVDVLRRASEARQDAEKERGRAPDESRPLEFQR